MIELMLQLFGGGGGKSGGGGGGAGSGGTGRGSHSSGKGSAGGTKNGSGGAPPSSKKSATVMESVKTIDDKAKYDVYNLQGKVLRTNVSGSVLNREVKDEKLKYNNDYRNWLIRSTRKQIVIRRRK